MKQRSDQEWLEELGGMGQVRESALEDLREIIFDGLSIALGDGFPQNPPPNTSFMQEVTQNTLDRVLDNMETFDGQSKFTTWIHKIAVHIALTELRRRRWKDVPLEDLTDVEQELTFPGLEISTEQRDVLIRIHGIIQNELTEKQRRAMTAIMEGMPVAEVARRMNMPPNELHKLLHDARLRLKRRMALEDLTPGAIFALFD